MYRYGDQIEKEVKEKLSEGKGCIIFDFSCYFPYANQEVLLFDFQLGEEKFNDIKKNHRYPNHGYVTLSKQTGRSVSKIGYPYFFDMSQEEHFMLLDVKIGLKDKCIDMVFPLNIKLTKEKPVCALSFKYHFDEDTFSFTTNEKCEDRGWRPFIWTNNVDNKYFKYTPDRVFLMDAPHEVGPFMVAYEEIITPVAQAIEDILV